MSAAPIGVIHYGLGPIGLAIARLVAERQSLRSVAALDIDPLLVGRDFGELIAGIPSGVSVTADATEAFTAPGRAIVVHCTGSALKRVAPQLIGCLNAGLSVISTCEELSYPWSAAPDLAGELDRTAKNRGAVLLGTGVNPGFVMDYLPVVLSAASRRVDAVRVHRVQDAGIRRLPLQQKIGAGLSASEFQERVRSGAVGHVGLSQSAQAVAAAFGWEFSELHNTVSPILAERLTPSGLGEISPGRVTGLHQVVVGLLDGREVLRLTLEMAVGIPDPRDDVELIGDPPIRMVIPGGLHGDVATAAVVVNSIGRVVEAAPGLRVMTELATPHA